MEVEFGDERAAGFAPQLGVHQDRHLFEGRLDDLHVEFEVRRGHAGVGGREAAADIDDVQHDAGFHDHGGGKLHRVAVGRRAHALRADVEGDAERVRIAPRLLQKGGSVLFGDAELVRQRVGRVLVGHGEAHDEREVVSALRCGDDLFQLRLAVEREDADAMLEIGALDSLARLHRVHERHLRVGIARRDQLDFLLGSDVEPAEARCVDGVERPRRRVRFDSVEHFARKVIPEPVGRYRNPVRTHACDRHFWESFPDQVQGRMKREQFTYTPVSC